MTTIFTKDVSILAPIAGNAAHDGKRERRLQKMPEPFASKNKTLTLVA